MSTLTKDTQLIGDPGTGGTPGTAPHPAYCYDLVVTKPRYIIVPTDFHDGSFHSFEIVFVGYGEEILHVCEPGSPGTAGTPGTPPTLEVVYNAGWNSGADSIDSMPGSGIFQFHVPRSSVGVVCGLTSGSSSVDYRDIQFGFYCTNGQYQVLENGVGKTAFASYADGDVFTVCRNGDEMTYYVGADDPSSVLLYTSLTQAVGPTLIADCALYFGGDSIN